MSSPLRPAATLLLCSLLVLASGCASTSPDGARELPRAVSTTDPYEGFNRTMNRFNTQADRFVLKPVAKGYDWFPGPVKNGIRNFFANLWELNTIANDLLQGKFAMAGRDTGRFVINSTLGLAGIADVASEMDLERRTEDFGQTLAYWGVPSGPYLVLPLLGPSNMRDAFGLLPQWYYTDVFAYVDTPEVWYLAALRLIDARSRLFGIDEILALQPDPYLFLRDAYRQRRLQLIHDGNPPAGQAGPTEDELLDELLDES